MVDLVNLFNNPIEKLLLVALTLRFFYFKKSLHRNINLKIKIISIIIIKYLADR